MVVVKSYPEASDKNAIYWTGSLDGITDNVELQGDDVVRQVFHRPLSEVVGCRIRVNNIMVTANYLYSEQKAFPGRDRAFNWIRGYRPYIEAPAPIELTDAKLLGNPVSFDCESGGSTKIRVITFYDGKTSWYVDCRDLKSNPGKVAMLRDIFTSKRYWIAHNFAHDMDLVSSTLKIPRFRVWKDTITLIDGYEFRNLGYLSGVVLGVAPYKHELEIANNTKNFDLLVRYCAKDSYYTYRLSEQVNLPDNLFVNQFIHTMLNPPSLVPVDSIYNYYPEWRGLKKKDLKAHLSDVDLDKAQLLLKAISPPKPTITLHSLDGFKVVVPDGLTYAGTLYMMTSSGATSVLDAMARDLHFFGAEVSAYRYTNQITPKFYEPRYPIEPEDVFLVNDVVCLTTKPTEGFTPCTFDQIRGLFYGR